ncbi:hypothetical protein CHU32_03505 [Superficieibacter electus]|uniref:Uncharacterized protein n=1 Tax=Superficieibacter electus TaxID=2022662 RepID=A0A2P5GVB5_9ENTR|nr:hypothetical protein [Superficieibacter electus]POP42313.1 hypothetical protein CHU33_19790 [Superficieibacter electus]POP50502.1 hypothetical protein CHU32_03505 [Superficieibacter electus]
MYTSEDIFDGYLRIDQLLSEIAEQGAAAQKQARENIGINGDIAYRDKENIFKEKNSFNQMTQFNDDTTVAAGKKIIAPTICLTYNGTQVGTLSGDAGKVTNLISDAKLRLGGATVHDLMYASGGHDYEVWHAGNYDPVRTVNYVGPDSDGNVNVQPIKFMGDGITVMVALFVPYYLFTGVSPVSVHFGALLPGYLLSPASLYKPWKTAETNLMFDEKYMPGIWRMCATTTNNSNDSDALGVGMAQRVSIGSITKFSNICQPFYPNEDRVDFFGGDHTDERFVCVRCDIEGVGDGLIFTSYVDDEEEYSRQIYQNAIAGMYGVIEPQNAPRRPKETVSSQVM